MAMILDAFVRRCAASLGDFAAQDACSILGVREDVEGLLTTLARIGAVVAFEERQRILNASVDSWVMQMKDLIYEVDDVVDVCMIEGGKILAEDCPSTPKVRCSFLFSCFKCANTAKFHHEVGIKIKDIDNRLKEIEEQMPEISSDMIMQDIGLKQNLCRDCVAGAKPCAVGTQVRKAVDGLVAKMLREGKKKVDVFAVVGVAGIGKTTLAREIYNDERVTENFPIRVWVRMSKDLSDMSFLKEIIRGASVDVGHTESKDELLALLSSALSKRFLIVLDDVWKPNIWDDLLKDPLGDGVARGRILITTRDVNVATSMKATVRHVDQMDAENGWELLCKEVLHDCRSEEIAMLKDAGTKIAEKCDGHPLAIKAIAGVLKLKEKNMAEWDKILNNNVWSIRWLREELPQGLHFSYEDLPSELKQCFLYCSLYPKEYRIRHFNLIRHWIAEGLVSMKDDKLLEDLAEEYYEELIGRNLLQQDPDNLDRCWIMHDLLRLLARSLITDETIFVDGQQRSSVSNLLTLSKPRRLSLCNMEDSLEDPISVKQQMSLRSVLLFNSPNIRAIDNLLFESAPSLRVLDLSNTAIEALPKSVGNLLHLRYLNLDGTKIRDLPAVIGFLINLQTLSLQNCQCLHRLPWSIRALLELRCLCLAGTPLSHVPKVVGDLKHLNHLSGLVIGHNDDQPEGCDLDDLQALSELRYLHIENLERATSGALALANKPFLKDLYLFEQAPIREEKLQEEKPIERKEEQKEEQEKQEQDEQKKEEKEQEQDGDAQAGEEEATRAGEKIWNELTPPPSIEKLVIKNYKGQNFPNWMMTPELGTSFPSLIFLDLDNCMSCTQLPPLGLLDQLKCLVIANADSIVAIGAEFLGLTASPTTAFPKLEVLKFRNLKNLQEWHLAVEENQELLPCLKSLGIQSCPKLKTLPEGLKHAPLRELCIEGAHSLTEIKDLPHLSDELRVKDNNVFHRISNLASLRSLTIDDCPKLKHVGGLDALQHLTLVFPPSTETFYFEELIIFWSVAFPRWLEVLIKKRNGLRRFDLRCSMPLLKSCLDGGKNWHVVQQIPEVRITSSDGKAFVRYNKGRRIYETNVQYEE